MENLLKPLSDKDYQALKESIKETGVIVPVVICGRTNIIIDGFHRTKICEELGIKDYPKEYVAGLSDEQRRQMARALNLARRQLTNEERREIVRQQLLETPNKCNRQIATALGVEHKLVGRQRKYLESIGSLPQCSERETADGRTYPVNRKPILKFNPPEHQMYALKNDEAVAKAQDEGISVRYAARVLNREEKAERLRIKQPVTMDDVKIFQADITTSTLVDEVPDESIDLMCVDAPYAANLVRQTYEHISHIAGRVLKPGKSLLVITGQAALPDAIRLLGANDEMRHHWVLCYSLPRVSPLLPQYRVSAYWKPIIWLTRGKYEGHYISDVIDVPPDKPTDKAYHPHGQSISGFEMLVERWSLPGETVMDCMMGAGTTGIAAVRLGRRFIGCDLEQKYVDIARERIEAEILGNSDE